MSAETTTPPGLLRQPIIRPGRRPIFMVTERPEVMADILSEWDARDAALMADLADHAADRETMRRMVFKVQAREAIHAADAERNKPRLGGFRDEG